MNVHDLFPLLGDSVAADMVVLHVDQGPIHDHKVSIAVRARWD